MYVCVKANIAVYNVCESKHIVHNMFENIAADNVFDLRCHWQSSMHSRVRLQRIVAT